MTFLQGITWGRFGISALLDWQKGSSIINLSKFLYDLGSNTADFDTAGRDRLMRQGTDAGVYIEDASFLKLREIDSTTTCRLIS